MYMYTKYTFQAKLSGDVGAFSPRLNKMERSYNPGLWAPKAKQVQYTHTQKKNILMYNKARHHNSNGKLL